MAKQAAPAPAPTEAVPAPSPFPKANPVGDVTTVDVVKWGNGEAVSSHAEPIVEAKPAEEAAKPTENKPTEKPAEEDTTPAETPAAKESAAESEEAPTEEPAPVDAKASERRKQIVESLAAERSKRAMEKQVEDARKAAEVATKAQEEFDNLPLAQKLSLVAKKHNMSVQELADRLLIGGEDVTEAAPAPAKPADPEVQSLKAEVEALKKDREARAETESRQKVEQAVARVQETLKDTDLPLVDTFNAYGRVMVKAHESWIAGGRVDTPLDYVPECAPVVEAELKAEHPKAAARLYTAKPAAEGVQAEEAPTEAPKPRVVAGKRVASRPEVKPKSLWEGGKSAIEVDAQIKKEMGWG